MPTREPELSRSANATLQGTSGPTLRPTLQQAVSAWRQRMGPRAVPTPEEGRALHTRFAAAADSFTFQYANVKDFFAGLEGLIGSPSPDIMDAMKRDHASDEVFEAWNADVKRSTTPRAEYAYVVEGRAGEAISDPESAAAASAGRGRQPSHVTDATGGRAGWKLEDFAAQPEIVSAGLLLPEVAGIRLYTGPMYAKYNGTLRTKSRGAYVTTLHAINSGIVKLSKQTKACTVYRGVSGGILPEEFWQANEHGVIGGVELGFMSTSTERDVALGYMKQSSKTSQILFEIRMGMIDRGADVSLLSQFPAEKEILFAPLTGLEVAAVPRDELGVLIIELRLSCNLQDQTLEQVVGKMQASHFALLDGMVQDLRLAGLPPTVLEPLRTVKTKGQERGREHFNVPHLYVEATKEAMGAKDACYALLATDEAWAGSEAASMAEEMTRAAQKCAMERYPEEAAALLTMAAARGGVLPHHRDAVVQVCQQHQFEPNEKQRHALEAASALLTAQDAASAGGLWAATLVELGARCGDRHTVVSLAEHHGQPPNALVRFVPHELGDLPLGRYKAQSHFHQIDTSFPGLQLISEEPYIFLVQSFLSDIECRELMLHYGQSSSLTGSAISSEQEKIRTSTQVLLRPGEFPWLTDRLARLCNVETDQLEAPKLTHYGKGQYFRPHNDARPAAKRPGGPCMRVKWFNELLEATKGGKELADEERGRLLEPDAGGSVPNRFITAFVYLRDVKEGGCTTFCSMDKMPDFYEKLEAIDTLQSRTPASLPPRSAPPKQKISIQPRAGMLVIHFPSTTSKYGCLTDPNTAHEGEDAVDPKYIVQQFIMSSAESKQRGLVMNATQFGKAKVGYAAPPQGLPPGA